MSESKEGIYDKYLYDQREDETVKIQADFVKKVCDRNWAAFQPHFTKQAEYENQANLSQYYKEQTPQKRMELSNGRYILYTDNKNENSNFQLPNRCIIAIPGAPGSVKDFTGIEKRLEGKLCRFIHVSMPGFDNQDERRGSYFGTLEDGVNLIKDLIDMLKVEKITFLMHSLGGFFSKYFAYRFPDKVDGLIQVASIPISEWLGWKFMRGMYDDYYGLKEEQEGINNSEQYFSLLNSDEARKRVDAGSNQFRQELGELNEFQKRQYGPALYFSVSDIISLRKITASLPGGIGEVLHCFRNIHPKVPRVIAYSPVDELAGKHLYEEEIYNLLNSPERMNYYSMPRKIPNGLDLTHPSNDFQTNFIFRFDKANHYFHYQRASELSVIIQHFMKTLDHIKPTVTSKL